MRFQLPGSLRASVSLFLLLLLLPVFSIQRQLAQTEELGPVDRANRAQLHQALLDLTNPFTVLCVAAHPDDEDGSSLTVLRRKYGVHTVSLFSTYGEGGQNAVGPELYEELGVIRARETMAAAEVQGSEPHFLGMRDFGFSKSAEEAFRVWGEKEALRRMVLEIRKLRPDAIITNHDTTSGHGHHQATGRLVLQAFDAAPDPKQFPEQLTQVTVWQPKRLFVRARGAAPSLQGSEPAQQFTIDPNEMDPIRAKTYAQQALEGLQKHATQGPWPMVISANGARIIRYNLVRQAPLTPPLPAGARTPLDGLSLSNSISRGFIAPTIDNKPLTDFLDNRKEILASLVNARKRGAFTAAKEVVDQDPQRFALMAARLDRALAEAAGVFLSAETDEPVLVPGQKTRITASLGNVGDAEVEVQIKHVGIRAFGVNHKIDTADKILPETDTSGDFDILTPKTATLSVPASEHLYDGKLFGPPLTVDAELAVDGARFSLALELHRNVTPPVEIASVDPDIYVTTPATATKPLAFKVRLINHLSSEFRGLARVVGPNLETGRELKLTPHSSDVVDIQVKTTLPLTRRTRAKSELVLTVDLTIPKTPLHRKTIPLVYANAAVAPDLQIGYLPSFDDTIARSLSALGVSSTRLSVSDISSGDLSRFSAIVLDNRAYEAHHELIPINDRLLKYVEDGGTLIVFYHKTNEWNPDTRQNRPQLAPYPILLGNDRVTEEDAAIGFLQPRHHLLTTPNRITQADFANWIQERGLYFPREWDSHYAALLTTNDRGEQPLQGGLLVAPYGKGNYIYTSLVWYRQLRAGIPGGYRFFANMISYGRERAESSATNRNP